jgi:hypothetical protein
VDGAGAGDGGGVVVKGRGLGGEAAGCEAAGFLGGALPKWGLVSGSEGNDETETSLSDFPKIFFNTPNMASHGLSTC